MSHWLNDQLLEVRDCEKIFFLTSNTINYCVWQIKKRSINTSQNEITVFFLKKRYRAKIGCLLQIFSQCEFLIGEIVKLLYFPLKSQFIIGISIPLLLVYLIY